MKHFKNIHVGAATIVLSAVPNLVKPQPIKIDVSNSDIQEEIVPWGSDNLYPQTFYKKFLENEASVGGAGTIISSLYGTGFSLMKWDDATETSKPVNIHKYPDIREFTRLSNFNRFWYETVTDHSLFGVAFTENILSKDKNTIARVKRLQTANCRYGVQNKKTGIVTKVFFNSDWETANKDYTIGFPYMHQDMTAEEIKELCKEKNLERFVTSSAVPLITESYYPQPWWHASFRSGWVDYVNGIPELKVAIAENQLHIKYIVYVSDFYFESFYKDEWDDFDADKRQKMREDLADLIDDHLAGNKAGGRSIVSPVFDEQGKFVKGIEVVPIKDELKDGSMLTDASVGNSVILFAWGVDPTIVGAGVPGGSNLSGSGSDKREAYTILCANGTPRRHIIFEPWNRAQQFNEWDPTLDAVFPNINLTTLDKNPDGQTKIVNG